jgi:hypothetical protein
METTIKKRQQKRQVFEGFLEQGDAFLVFDPRKGGVIVPEHLRKQNSLSLQFGYNLVIPICDLTITDDLVTGTLSFDRSPFWCAIPWDAVFAVISAGELGVGWPEDFPPDLTKEGYNKEKQQNLKQRHLRVVGK